MSNNQLKYIILAGLFVIPFVPLIVSSSLFFPFITGKAFVFRLIVEIIFACYLVLAIRDESYRPKFSWILGALFVFLVVIGIADIFAENSFKAFWSNYERMEGFITLLHLGALFVVLGSVLKTQKVWNRLLATSLAASVIMSVYSFFQLAGKLTINQGGVRADGTLGNASYLGIYMVFHIFFAALLFSHFRKRWQRVLLIIAALMNMIVLYFTATRGAILGFVGGALIVLIYLLVRSEKGSRVRKIAAIGTIIFVIFVGLFFALKNTSFVKNSPVLSRFSSLSLSEVKTQGRYFVWPMAVKGFTEKPILGWGQEGFNFVFNKYYDPRMYNQEPWFDRAHSTPLDWLIAGGALGLLSYLAIIFYFLYYVFKARGDSLDKKEKAVLLGLIAAYFFNNLFVFDQISSYILFFTIIAYVHSRVSGITSISCWDKISAGLKKLVENAKAKPVIEALIFILMMIFIYSVVYVPWRHNKSLLTALKSSNEGKMEEVEIYTKPLSTSGLGFSESLEHISQIAMGVSSRSEASSELKQELFNAVEGAFEKHIGNVPHDTRYRLFYGVFLSRFGWYGRALEQLEEAQELSPKKQQIYFELINNLLLEGRIKEALQTAKTNYELEPSYIEAKFVYGLTLLASGDFALSEEILKDIPESKIIFDDRYLTMLLAIKQFNQIIEVAKKRIELDPENIQHRITLAAAYLQAERRQEAIFVLEEIIKLEPSFKEQGEYYINEIKAGRNP